MVALVGPAAGRTYRVGVDLLPTGAFGGASDGAIHTGAVWACIQRIASRVGAAHFRVARFQRDTATWQEMPNHELNRVYRSPSPRLPAYVFWRSVAEHVLVTGNAYLVHGQEGALGRPRYLMLSGSNVSVATVNGQVVYRGHLPGPGGMSQPWERFIDGVAHVRGPHLDVGSGKSASPVQSAASAAIGLHRSAIDTARAAMANAARFSGKFKTMVPGADNEETLAYFEDLKKLVADTDNKGGTLVLPHGIDYELMQALQRDMQLAGDLNWTVQEIARIYGVPLAMIQHTAGQRQDIEQLEEGLLRDAVWPILHAVAAALTMSGLSGDERLGGLSVRAHIDAGGPTQSGQVDRVMKMGQTGAVSINEMRQALGLPPREGGDDLPQTAGAGEREPGEEGPPGAEPEPEPEEDTGNGDD